MRMRCASLSSWDSAAMVRFLCKSNWVGTTRRVQCLCTAPCAVVFQDNSPFTGNRLTIFQPCVCVLLYTVALPGSGSGAHLKYDAEPVSLTFLASKNRLYDVHSSAIERATLKKININIWTIKYDAVACPVCSDVHLAILLTLGSIIYKKIPPQTCREAVYHGRY